MSQRFLKVQLADRPRLVELEHIREIVAMCEVQAVDADDPVCAVLNLRGDIVPLIDLAADGRALTPERFVLVCSGEEGDFGVVVDDVEDIVEVPEDQVILIPGRPAFARLDHTMYPVIQPRLAWHDRDLRVPPRPAEVSRDSERQLLQARAERYADHDHTSHDTGAEHAVIVRLGRRYAVDLTHLREIRILDALCRVPEAPRHIPGVIHSRGRLLSAHDLGAYLADDPVPETYRWLVVVEDQDRQLGLLADEVEGIRPIASSHSRPTPIAMGPRAACFSGIVEGDLLLVHPTGLFDTSFSLSA